MPDALSSPQEMKMPPFPRRRDTAVPDALLSPQEMKMPQFPRRRDSTAPDALLPTVTHSGDTASASVVYGLQSIRDNKDVHIGRMLSHHIYFLLCL